MKYKILNFIIKLLLSVLLGISISFIITQKNAEFKQLVQEKVQLALEEIFLANQNTINQDNLKPDNLKQDSANTSTKNKFSKQTPLEIKCKVASINLFVPKIELEYLKIKAKNKSFLWTCKPIEIGFSWIDFILGGLIDIYIDIHSLNLKSKLEIKNRNFDLAVLPNIMSLITAPAGDIPTNLKHIIIRNGKINIFDTKNENKSFLNFSSITKNFYGKYKTKISAKDGDLTIYSKNLYNKFNGNVEFDIWQNNGNINFYLNCKNSLDAKIKDITKTCFISGKWENGIGLFNIASQDKSFYLSDTKLYFENNSFFVESLLDGDLNTLKNIFLENEKNKSTELEGLCKGKLCAEFGTYGFGIHGTLDLEKVKYKISPEYSIAIDGNITIKNIEAQHFGNFSTNISTNILPENNELSLSGDFNVDINKQLFSLNLTNESKLKIPVLSDLEILPKKINLSINNDLPGNFIESLSGKLSCITSKSIVDNSDKTSQDKTNENKKNSDKSYSNKEINNKTNKNIKNKNFTITGDLKLKNNVFSAAGNIDDKKYDLSVDIFPITNLLKLSCKNSAGNQLFYISAIDNDHNKFKGSIDFSFLQYLSKQHFDYDLQGQGDLKFYGMRENNSILLDINFKNASISIPNIYNFLNNFKITCKIDPVNKILVAKNSIINFHKGFVTSKKTVLQFDNNFELSYVYAPFVFNNCFLNLKTDLFALVSGRMLFSKNKNSDANLQGLAIIERGYLKKNIFADNEKKKYIKPSGSKSIEKNFLTTCNCDISVVTKDPVRINTDFINTNATLNLSIKNKIFDPQITGKIDLSSGTLDFPYKSLNISKGSIYFLEHQSWDPIIELYASNKINKYNISMYASGPLENYNISFESNPPLNEEQIIALLIAGSAQDSLNVVAPAILVQTIKDSLFGSGNSKITKNNYIDKILKPFKNVRLVPSFTDQSGRGGLRGTLEVDLNERARAMVEKNLSLTEDTRFELEYMLADDVAIRGVRRENGDIGGEVEMRWKF